MRTVDADEQALRNTIRAPLVFLKLTCTREASVFHRRTIAE